ncbi:pentatricopeptide repeat-containing protein At3g58590 [Andrographis paniculata]|uniref:pentatricopeptide repeat-containing protein At3g58590 n=1 Tax=Andrographis paniculata TaxID=175694 RepID=UPI0021E9068B|nr:pentatricopeptide repeat-containing protein At3g58590 [Andrographis paniculata]
MVLSPCSCRLLLRIRTISSWNVLIPPIRRLHFAVDSNAQTIRQYGYTHLLHDPTNLASLGDAKSLHAIIVTKGSDSIENLVFVHNNILATYASFGDTHLARKLFDEMTQRNVVSYNTMISAYSRDNLLVEAFNFLSEMRKRGLTPTQFTLGGLLSCDQLDIFEGVQLQALIEKTGLLLMDAFTGTAILGMYGRQRCLDEAVRMFESMPGKTLVTWNCMISIFAQMGYLKDCIAMFSELMSTHLGISKYTVVNVLSGLGEDMQLGEQVHGLVIKYGFDCIASISNCLISMYSRSGAPYLAMNIFENSPSKDLVTWNTLIGVMANGDTPIKAFDIFLKMQMKGLSPNETTLVNILSSCSRANFSSYGKYVHAKTIKKGFESEVSAGSSLVNFYAKCGKIQESRKCFDGVTQKNTVLWNSLMQAYMNSGCSVSIRLLQEMIRSGYYPNEVSISIVINSSMLESELLQLHSIAIKYGFDENAYVLSSLISSYARKGLVSDALFVVDSGSSKLPVVSSNIVAWIYNRTGQYEKTQELYASLENPDVVSWNILIAACSRNCDYVETFELFDHMRRSSIRPDSYTYVSLFSVCTKLCNLALGSSLHGLIVKSNAKLCDTFVCNVMIDMYGKCGSIESSVKIFDAIDDKNVISWTALLSALGLHGYANEALQRFEEMQATGTMIRPDKVTLMAILSACRHGGLVKQGMDLLDKMKVKYGVEPEIDHYAVVVDLLTRNGCVKEAEQLILGMPIAPNALIWRSFLEGCKKRRAMNSYW